MEMVCCRSIRRYGKRYRTSVYYHGWVYSLCLSSNTHVLLIIPTLDMRLDYWLLHGLKYLSFPADLCTCMTTVEITRHEQAASGVKLSHLHIVDIQRREGLAGMSSVYDR